MAHSPLIRFLRRLLLEHRDTEGLGLTVEAVRERRAAARTTRRQLLIGSAAAATLAWACSDPDEGAPAGASDAGVDATDPRLDAGSDALGDGSVAPPPRIAIVGAGIAGLTCALTLKDQGVTATVYDISKHRVGGRMVTERGSEPTGCNSCHVAPSLATNTSWDDAQVTDIYGELIDSGHTTIRDLAKRFQLTLTDALAAEPEGSTETWYFKAGYYDPADANADFAAVYAQLQKDAEDAGWPVTYDTANDAARALDAMSVYDWIEARVPGGHASRLGMLLDAAYAMEFAADTKDQSALNILSMLAGSPEELTVLGESDEQYRIQGGVDQLPRAIADVLGIGTAVQLGWAMKAIAKEADGTYTLTFMVDGAERIVTADYVVLAIPFATLRELDFAKAGFDALKERAIREQGAGRSNKLQLQFKKRLWNESGPWGISSGTTYSDTGYQLTWDPTRGQPGPSGILAAFCGGSAAAAKRLNHPYGNTGVPAVIKDAEDVLAQLEPVFPGITSQWNGKACSSMPHLDPRFRGSYAYYKVGQTTAFCGYERVPQGNVYFCGEHTSVESLGFMEGAAAEGQATGEAIAKQLA